MLITGAIRETTLNNGLRVVSEAVPGMSGVAVGLRIDVGSRDEPEDLAGISHLVEHMVFKGTGRRSAREIAEEFDAVGGHIDAYTTKEYTGYGLRVLPEHLPGALDILGDMLNHSRLDPAEMELEKAVILEEYKSLEDSPEEFVHEIFTRALWPGHPLGRPVIGRPEVIAGLTRDDLVGFLADHYLPGHMVCAAAGSVDHDDLVGLLAAQFAGPSALAPARSLEAPEVAATRTLMHRPIEQAHFVLGAAGVTETDSDRWAVRVLALIAGGGMSSRLFQEVREKRGLCYSIAAEVTSYRDAGMFVVYADSSREQMAQVEELTRAELALLARDGVRRDELRRAKEQVRAGTLLSLDDSGSRMSRLARSLLYHGRVTPLEEVMAEINALTLEDIQRAAHRLFGVGSYALAAIGPFGKRAAARTKPH